MATACLSTCASERARQAVSLGLLASLAEIAEPGELRLEVQVEVAGRAVAVLRELEPDDALVAVLPVLLPQEHDEVGVGLKGARLAEVAEHRLGAARFDLAREL